MANTIVRSFDPVRAHSGNVDFSLKAFSILLSHKDIIFGSIVLTEQFFEEVIIDF